MKIQRSREAFSILTAIVIIVLMAMVAMFVMNLSGKIVKSTTAQFQHEQAELYAKSYTEYAVLAVTAHNRTADCIDTITASIQTDTSAGAPSVAQGNGYRVRTHISYIGTPAEIGSCTPIRKLSINVTTPKTPLTIIIDTYVDYKDPDNTAGPWLTVHRRSVQKI
jgi:type II secretory pathway pseudopilin PulG